LAKNIIAIIAGIRDIGCALWAFYVITEYYKYE
jgi:hypothetical protein